MTIRTHLAARHLAALVIACGSFTALPATADQAACEAKVRALMAPFGDDAPTHGLHRFGTSVTAFGKTEMRGYSLQTAEGSVYYDQDKNPVSLSFVNGDVYSSTDKGKTWKLVNSTSKEQMDKVIADLREQASKATDIVCTENVDLDGRKVHHYAVDYVLESTGQKAHSEYWVDPETGFVWRDVTNFYGNPDTVITVDAKPAPEMTLPDPKVE